MFADCHGSVWHLDDFTHCFQHDFLQTLFPLIFCGASAIFIAAELLSKALHSKYFPADTLLNYWNHVRGFEIPTSGHEQLPQDEDNEDAEEDEIQRNAQLALHPSVSQIGRTTIVEADRPRGELFLVFVEIMAVFAELVINISALATDAWGKKGGAAEIAGIAFWAYVLLIVIARFLLSKSQSSSFSKLCYHTAFLYGFNWLITVLLFRSYLIYPRSPTSQHLMIANFSFLSLLTLISLTSRKGNKAVEMEWEGEIEPPREQIASVLSLATFSWVDPIVWKGYKKTFELADVWNLAVHDKASVVLADYRQVKKTSILAWHLLKYFKGKLLLQASWACFSGFLTFAPTLLLRSILQYVEAPEDTPKATAWLLVILLFVAGCSSALADGHALWLGRRVCIRLRAVIIGELYTKALRRKVGTRREKVLGAQKTANPDSEGKGGVRGFFVRFKRSRKAAKPASSLPKAAEESDSQTTAGTVINLMAVDSFKVSEVAAYLHFLWAETPVQFILAIVLLYQVLGFSSLAGIGMMIVLLPVNMWISKAFANAQKKILAATDARIHATNEVLTNIRIIKYFAWEERFIANIDEKRAVELRYLRLRFIIWTLASAIWSSAPVFITLLSFAIFTLVEKKDLIPSVAFTALSLFQILRIPLDQLADMVAHVQESKVSVDRVEEFLNEEDTQKYQQLRHTEISNGEPTIGFEKATFTWGGNTQDSFDVEAFRMMDLDFKFEVGQLNVVVGPTGSGKTSLLMALLGEMTLLNGSVYLPGGRSREDLSRDPETGLIESVAYCAQQAWLVNDTVKQNIVFASPWDPKRYDEVITACALKKDMEILDDGDETLVGEKGVTLSGGQKQRVSLARALYCNARHILLDDILSAVDSHTGKWIFEQALMGPLMENRTCVLVTHNITLCLPQAQFAVVLDNGRVTAQGSAAHVILSGTLSEDLTKSTPASKAPSRLPSATPSDDEDEDATELNMPATRINGKADGHTGTKHNKLRLPRSTMTPGKNALEEGKATGRIQFSIIWMYLRSMGPWYFWIAMLVILGIHQISSVSTNVWIRVWANAYASKNYRLSNAPNPTSMGYLAGVNVWSPCISSDACPLAIPSANITELTVAAFIQQKVNDGYFLGIYALLGFVFIFLTLFRDAAVFGGSLVASRKIHSRLIESVSYAKFRFFDSTPLGQIMNRFSKDIENIDQEVAPVAIGVVHCLASMITIVVLISIITPGFLIAGTFISILYLFIGKFYINSSRDLKRLESVQRSPLYQQFGETLSGMTTIRAYGDERRFIRENLNRVNTHNRPFLYLWAANRWLAFRVDVAGALVSFFSGVFVVLSVGTISAGAAGLALTYAVTFTENVLWFVRLYANNEQNMNSVERVKEYLDVEQEAKATILETKPAPNWPSQGAVEFINYSTSYRKDFDPVLKHLTFKIAPAEKVGIVGRTGAGKSSLALALFRALEAEEGKILIDDVDIGLIGLRDLRENVVMVPQDPTLFSGTIRSNLDPFDLFTDEDIFTALWRVQLIDTRSAAPTPSRPAAPIVSTSEGHDTTSDSPSTPSPAENKNIFLNLSSSVSESGSNLSQGQRQLLCLARALLKEPKVLLMDEATASIDYATDAKIQETIRKTKGGTIITIAHRLRTIIDYDKVLVLERGKLVEWGSPWELLRPRTSAEEQQGDDEGKMWFRGMCEMSGELETLEAEAKKSWESKRLVDDE